MTHTCERCLDLEEQVRQLEAQLYGRHWEAPRELRFTALEEAIVATMLAANGRACSSEFLIDATRGLRGCHRQNPTSNIIDTKLCHVRAKMRPYGLTIETVWGRGWCITRTTRQKLLNWAKQEAA